MLGKLLKYEMKATGRIFLPLFISLLVFAGINRVISALVPQNLSFPSIISMAAYAIILVGLFVMTFIMMIQRFYKNLLSDEGYLMFTLPTRPWQHIMSKLLVSMFWIITSIVIAMISILIIASEKGLLTEIAQGFSVVFTEINQKLGTSGYLFVLEMIVGIFISLATSILLIYASIAIGHLLNRHRVLASFGALIILNTLTQILFLFVGLATKRANFTGFHISADNFAAMQTLLHLVIISAIVFTGLIGTAYFTTTHFILSKRLNLE